jgi:hypothetical protein
MPHLVSHGDAVADHCPDEMAAADDTQRRAGPDRSLPLRGDSDDVGGLGSRARSCLSYFKRMSLFAGFSERIACGLVLWRRWWWGVWGVGSGLRVGWC